MKSGLSFAASFAVNVLCASAVHSRVTVIGSQSRSMEIEMIRHGVAPFLECSSKGDRRFSAFYAQVNGKSIEEWYQARKIFEGGVTGLTWREAKGRKAINAEQCAIFYSHLWDMYMKNHPELLPIIRAASGLSDIFGQPGHVCQATELWRIRNGD